MVEELGSIEMLKNDFISNVSHETKRPWQLFRVMPWQSNTRAYANGGFHTRDQ